MDDWAEKARPARLGDMIGQTEAVADVTRFIRQGERRNLLIHGPSGVGKTTLALAYARAQLCPESASRGDACGECFHCKSFPNSPAFQHLNGALVDPERIRYLMGEVQGRSSIYEVLAYYVDEARHLPPEAWEMMYAQMEQPSTPALFIFSLIDLLDAPEPARNRAVDIALLPPTYAESRAVIERALIAQNVAYDEEALSLMPLLGDDFRAQIKAVDELNRASDGVMDIALLRRRHGQDRGLRVLEYLEAIASGRSGAALDALDTIRLPTSEIPLAIRDFLVFLIAHHSGGAGPSRPCSLPPALTPLDRRETLAAALADLWRPAADDRCSMQRLVDYWSGPTSTDAAELTARALAFEQFTRSLSEIGPTLERSRSRRPGAQGRRAHACLPRIRTSAWEHGLGRPQVRELYSAASFALQGLDAPFNISVEIRGRIPGPCDARFTKSVGDVCHRLSERIKDQQGAGGLGFEYIAIFGQSAHGAPEALVVGHAAPAQLEKAGKWLADRARRPDGPAITPRVHAASSARAAVRNHWSLVRRLWWGVSGHIRTPTGQRLIDMLAPAGTPGPAGAVEGRRYTVSNSLGATARAKASRDISLLSAFDDQAWSHLYAGWEASEFAIRQTEMKRRKDALARLEDRFPRRDGPDRSIFEARRSALIATWRDDPKSLVRSWKGWW